MTTDRSGLTALPAWHALTAHSEQMRDRHLRSLSPTTPRAAGFAAEGAGHKARGQPGEIDISETLRLGSQASRPESMVRLSGVRS